jgi:DNA-binding GntR family transcriptional regulator
MRQPDSLHDYVVDRIREMIVDGELAPGSSIDEMAVAAALGVSRGPVREALKVLRAEGIVEIRPRRGAQVVELTPKRVRDLYEVLANLESMAVCHVCERASDAEIAEISDLNEAMRSHFERRNLRLYSALNQEIHERIVTCSANLVLVEIYGRVATRARMARFGVEMTDARWKEAMAEHDAITQALRRRDRERAAALLREHAFAVADILCQQLQAEAVEPYYSVYHNPLSG